MIKQLGTYLFIAGSICAVAASDLPTVAVANGVIAASMRAESAAIDSEMQIASLEEAFPSAESALAAVATAQATTRFEH